MYFKSKVCFQMKENTYGKHNLCKLSIKKLYTRSSLTQEIYRQIYVQCIKFMTLLHKIFYYNYVENSLYKWIEHILRKNKHMQVSQQYANVKLYKDWKCANIPEIHLVKYTCTRTFGHF